MTLSEFVKKTHKPKDGYCFRPRLICNDGFSMSIQGSSGHYCGPRLTQDWYNSMEIGFPSQMEIDLMAFAEISEDPTGTVYGYVPCDIIESVIEKHGGINVSKMFQNDNN